ncbi:hypothetical protein SS50377_23401 [Spironucleus salmonicida]|uniref:Uncharacterized protein n=1 Tax=Spironucleus salmonicida TaxID=348837 RepID=V6LRI7_9EUKA|nr:hypothetical protein SS50377_23401 [Spironucleus salmonicida]|eukprot:EST47272.1 Hypothetical protein SS50377_12782 [Spironucleus salmonicida]
MELIEELDYMMKTQPTVSFKGEFSQFGSQINSMNVSDKLDISLMMKLQNKKPNSLFESQIQSSQVKKTLTPQKKNSNSQSQTSISINSVQQKHTQSTNMNIAKILAPVKQNFTNGSFILSLTKNLQYYTIQELEAEIGQFYIDQLKNQDLSLENLNKSQGFNNQSQVLYIQIFTRALTKYLIEIQKVPKFNQISIYQSIIGQTHEIIIPQKEFICIIKDEYTYEMMIQIKKPQPQHIITSKKQVKESKMQQTTNRLYREHFIKQQKNDEKIKQKQKQEINECTFNPETNIVDVTVRQNYDMGVSKFLEKQQKIVQQETQELIEVLIQEVKEEASFYSLKLSQDFIDEVYDDLKLADEQSLQKRIVQNVKNLFHKKYMQLQSKQIKKSISTGKIQQIVTDFTNTDQVFLQNQHKTIASYDTKLATIRVQKQQQLDQEHQILDQKREQLNKKEEQAVTRSKITKQSMKGGGAFSIDFSKSKFNSTKEGLQMSAEAIRNVANGGVVTLWTAAGSVRK